jgi:ABC-type multidrug transport system fused ATPase/permease subunit
MHAKLTIAVLGSPMRFFETTPVGRIINRFSKDLSDIDLTVMFTIMRFGTVLLGAVVRLVIVSFVTPPFAFAFFLLFFYWKIAQYYLVTSREVKRIESVSNSPIYALFGESLNGTSTIRAYGAEHDFIRKILKKVDANHRAFFYLFATNRWLLFRTALLSCAIVASAGVSILLSGLSAGWAGVAFNFASQITNMIANSIQVHSSLEMAMNAVERVEEYSHLQQEVIEGTIHPPVDWPQDGAVCVDNLVIRYAPELPEVLKGISFKINPREKLAVVGRTGAGKSTLSMAFFRILDAVNGTIYIDDIDISKLGVRDLRSRLTIIPQDPILFEGTLRSNLDPLQEHDDDKIWEALKLTHVLESFQQTDNSNSLSLDTAVNENGSNFSQGQRQLLCLARALLRQTKFIFRNFKLIPS